jgi:hypothetical protein
MYETNKSPIAICFPTSLGDTISVTQSLAPTGIITTSRSPQDFDAPSSIMQSGSTRLESGTSQIQQKLCLVAPSKNAAEHKTCLKEAICRRLKTRTQVSASSKWSIFNQLTVIDDPIWKQHFEAQSLQPGAETMQLFDPRINTSQT